MADFSYDGYAQAVCELNIQPYTIYPYTIYLDDVPTGDPTEPDDILLGGFVFAKWDGTPDDYWIATSHGTSGADVIDGNGLLASIEASSGGTVAQAGNGTYLGDNVYFQIWGWDGNDTITGGANWDKLYGGNGNDFLSGLGGSDQVYGDAGNDNASGGDGNDWVDGGGDSDVVNGGAGNDNVVGGTGSDAVNGGDGDDNLFGDTDGMSITHPLNGGGYYAPETFADGADLMDGGLGNDHMFGQGGNDIMRGGVGNDGMDGGSGNDRMLGGDGNDHVTGGWGNDNLQGNVGYDLMNGGDGDDVLNGGDGKDWISGGAGDDTLTGGGASDHFVFCDDCAGNDYITDFSTVRDRDQIDLTQMWGLDLIISMETGDPNSAFLELINFGLDETIGGGDDITIGSIYIDSLQLIGRVFDLDTTFGTSRYSLVRVNEGVLTDLPSDSWVYNNDLA